MLISYYADLCSSMPQILLTIALKLLLCSWASPSFHKTGGRKAKLASGFCSIVLVNYIIYQYISQAKSCQIITKNHCGNVPRNARSYFLLYRKDRLAESFFQTRSKKEGDRKKGLLVTGRTVNEKV